MFGITTHKSSFIQRFFAGFRYVYIKLRYRSNLIIDGLIYVGKTSRIIIGKKASLYLGGKSHLFNNIELQSQGNLIIGSHFSMNSYSRIVAYERIEIGEHVTLAQFVTILDHDHGYHFSEGNLKLSGYETKPIKIGNHVWFGDKCTVLKGVEIGNNVIVAANTVVNKNVPSNCIIGGVPFKILKKLDN